MGCNQTKTVPSVAKVSHADQDHRRSESSNKFYEKRTLSIVPRDSIDLSPLEDDAFSTMIHQQRHDAIENKVYRKTIDNWRPSSIEELISFIQELSMNTNKIDQAWIIFYWISQNISYDTDAFFGNLIGVQNASSVFQSGKAVCEGYSLLYAELCQRMGIACDIVNGYGKGFEFNIRQVKFDKTNHAWNIIELDNGHLYFVESTWGSGYIDRSTHRYKKKLVADYFLCRPEHMIYKHLPKEEKYQLLAYPITMEQYLMLPHTYPEFFENDLKIISPLHSNEVNLVEGESYGLVLIRTPNNTIELSGCLEDIEGNKIDGQHLVYSDKEDQTLWRCQFAPPEPGYYNIFIFAGKKSHQNEPLAAVIQLAFDVNYLPLPPISYPHIWSEFFDDNIEIIKPNNSRFIDWPSKSNTSYCKILVRSSDAVRVSAALKVSKTGTDVKNGTLVNFDHEKNLWHCLFAPSNVGVEFQLTLFARRPSENKSHSVAEFILRPIPDHALEQPMTFPEIYLPFYNNKCLLIEPLNGVLQQGSIVQFRCQIPLAQKVFVAVDGDWIDDIGLKPNANYVFNGTIQVGQTDVAIFASFDDKNDSYSGLLKYSVS